MVRADMHVHSACSFDSNAPMREMCASALESGLEALAFTEHHDSNVPLWHLDIPAYLARIDEVRAEFPELLILRSIEAGYARGFSPQLQSAIKAVRPDFVLLSCHSVNGIDPFHAEAYYEGRTRVEGSLAYLSELLQAMEEIPDFDSLAHIGYSARYAPPGETARPLAYPDAPDLIDRILERLIRGGQSLEVNTSLMAKGGLPVPGEDILRRYFAMGGRMLTLGSDAHTAGGLAAGFADAARMLSGIGFAGYVVYREREAQRRMW